MNAIPPLLTLEELRESGPLGQQLIMAARHHVGEAGLEQAASLERLLVVCRHQAAVSTALRSLGWALSQSADGAHEAARAALLSALDTQLEQAGRAETVLAGALRDITSTPVVFLSAALLTDIELGARAQLEGAEQLLAQAHQVSTDSQGRAALEGVDQGMREALARSAEQAADGQAQVLTHLISQAAARLLALPRLPSPALAERLEDVAASLRVAAAAQLPPQGT